MHLTSLSALLALGLGLGLGTAGAPVAAAPAALAVDSDPVQVTIAVPITVPDGLTPLLTAEQLATYTRATGTLTRQLDAVAGTPAAIGVDPRIIASIRILGSSAPPSALAWLDDLATVSNEVFPLAYADADVTLATQAGAERVPQPESLEFAIDPALFTSEPAPPDPADTADPTPTPTSTAPPLVVPSTVDLFAWPYEVTGLAWPRDDTVVASDVATIAASGFTSTIITSGNLLRASTGGSMASVGDHQVLVSDDSVSTAFRAAARSTSLELWDTAIATMLEGVAAAGRTQPGTATVFVTLDREPLGVSNRLAETIAALSTSPSAAVIPLTETLALGPTEATVVDEPQPQDRLSQIGQVLEAEAAERGFATVADDPSLITSERRLELLALLSNSWVDSPDEWSEAAGLFITESVALRNSVRLVQSSSFSLFADNGQFLPITVKNDLNQPVTVYITVRPSSALLSIQNQPVMVELEAGVQSKVNVPVQSLSNGVVDIEVTLASVTGVSLGSPLHTEVNVQAGWETPVVVVIAILVLLVFVVGVVRTVLRRRRLVGQDHTGTADD